MISICIPVRNGGNFLQRAIESAMRQDFGDYEIVVVDNASTDGTVQFIETLAAHNSRIRFFKNECNIGLVGNFNACLKQAKGEYIQFLCADDFLLPSCLEKMARELDRQPSVSMVASGRLIVDELERSLGTRRYARKETVIRGTEAINRCLFGANYIGEPTAVMFRRDAATRGFMEEFSHLMDMEMWFHLLEQGDLYILPEPLCAIRRHGAQMTVKSIKSGTLVEDNVRLFEKYGRKAYVKNTWTDNILRKVRMAYRIWMSRKYLDPARRKEILELYSFPLVYHMIMPVFGNLLIFYRNLRQHRRTA